MQEDVGFAVVLWSTTCLVVVLTCVVVALAGGGPGYVLGAAAGAAAGYLPLRFARTLARRRPQDRTTV